MMTFIDKRGALGPIGRAFDLGLGASGIALRV